MSDDDARIDPDEHRDVLLPVIERWFPDDDAPYDRIDELMRAARLGGFEPGVKEWAVEWWSARMVDAEAERDRLRAVVDEAMAYLRTLTDHWREDGAHVPADQTAAVYRILAAGLLDGSGITGPGSEAEPMDGSEIGRRLGGAIVHFRAEAGISGTELAKRIGVDQSMVSQYERAASVPPVHRVVAIEDALHLRRGAIFVWAHLVDLQAFGDAGHQDEAALLRYQEAFAAGDLHALAVLLQDAGRVRAATRAAAVRAMRTSPDAQEAPEGAARLGGLRPPLAHTSVRAPRSPTSGQDHGAPTSRAQGERADGSIAGEGDHRQGGNE